MESGGFPKRGRAMLGVGCGKGFGFIPPVAAIVATVRLVVLTDASVGAKLTVIAVCLASFVVPKVAPSPSWSAGPVQALLSIVIIVYLKCTDHPG